MALIRKGKREFVDNLVLAMEKIGTPIASEVDPGDLVKRLDGLLSTESKTRYTAEASQTFCCVIGDNNPLHRSKTYAKRMGFEETIAPGTLASGRAENLVQRMCNALTENFGTNFKLRRQKTSFRNPIYHETTVDWTPGSELHADADYITMGLIATTRGEEKFSAEMELGKTLAPNSSELYGPLCIGKYIITTEQLSAYCESLGIEPSEEIPMNYVASFVTSLLLEKSKSYDGMPTGINRATNFSFHRRAELGEVAVDVYLKRPPKSGGEGYVYRFDAVCSQKHKAVVTGQITVLSKKELQGF